jgi:hypothetical protein
MAAAFASSCIRRTSLSSLSVRRMAVPVAAVIKRSGANWDGQKQLRTKNALEDINHKRD